jgi:hypothetical protein
MTDQSRIVSQEGDYSNFTWHCVSPLTQVVLFSVRALPGRQDVVGWPRPALVSRPTQPIASLRIVAARATVGVKPSLG